MQIINPERKLQTVGGSTDSGRPLASQPSLETVTCGVIMPDTSTSNSRHYSSASTAKKLIHAIAVAAALILLASIETEAAVITCESNFFDGAGCDGQVGLYDDPDDSNIWKFTDDFQNIIYSLEITGVDGDAEYFETFSLDVSDRVIDDDTTLNLSEAFGDAICIPMFDQGHCTIFDVRVLVDGEPIEGEFFFDYEMTMTWFINGNALSQPSTSANNRILKAATGSNDFFNEALTDGFYDPMPDPDDPNDPALGGRGSSFSSFVGTTTVPEPTTLLLFGTAAAATLIRRRRRK